MARTQSMYPQKKKHGCLRFLLSVAVVFAVLTAAICCDPIDSAKSVADEVSLLFTDGTEGLSQDRYDPQIRAYYALLSESEQEDYRRIVSSLLEGDSQAKLTGENSNESVKRIVESVLNDNPDIFWLGSDFTMRGVDKVDSVEFSLLYSGDDLAQRRAEVDEATARIIEPMKGMSSVEREKAVFDYLAQSVVYDGGSVDDGQGIYSALIEGRAVCAGYSRAFQHLMLTLGEKCLYVTGEAYSTDFFESGWGGHAWNLVELDGRFYNVDSTWGDSTAFDSECILYQYFNASDDQISSDHFRSDLSMQLPACGSRFDFESTFGIDPAVASLESAGFAVDGVAYSKGDYVDIVSARGDDLASGGFTVIVVARGMDEGDLENARSSALDALLSYASPGQSVAFSGTTQHCGDGVDFLKDTYTLA